MTLHLPMETVQRSEMQLTTYPPISQSLSHCVTESDFQYISLRVKFTVALGSCGFFFSICCVVLC